MYMLQPRWLVNKKYDHALLEARVNTRVSNKTYKHVNILCSGKQCTVKIGFLFTSHGKTNLTIWVMVF